MDKQIAHLSLQIEKAYSKMNTKPYYLHALSIHDGNAYSGHYYALIYDRYNKKWRRFNDIRVSDIPEEEVFTQANGGHGH